VHHIVLDARGRKSGAILWECKNARNWSDGWIAKLKQDQRSLHAEIAVLVSATLPKGCTRFALIDGVLVTDFASVAGLAAVLRQPVSAGTDAQRGNQQRRKAGAVVSIFVGD